MFGEPASMRQADRGEKAVGQLVQAVYRAWLDPWRSGRKIHGRERFFSPDLWLAAVSGSLGPDTPYLAGLERPGSESTPASLVILLLSGRETEARRL